MVEYYIGCGRQAPSPDSSTYMLWRATAADDLVCPDYATSDERTDDDAIELSENDDRL